VARRVRFIVPVLLAASLSAHAQTERSAYAEIVDQYATGDIDRALSAVARLPPPVVADAVRRYRDRLTAAAMLHTEFANDVIDATPARATFHIDQARTLVRALLDRDKHDADAADFARHWHEFVASIYLARAKLDEAERAVREGLSRFPTDAVLYVAQGRIFEMQLFARPADVNAGSMLTNPRRVPPAPTFNSAPRASRSTARLLEDAAAAYRHALECDPHLAEAHLRLGWVHAQQKDGRARADLQRALDDAGDASARYLAHLFLGGVDEREHRWTEALQHYDAARQADGRSPSACVAASYAHEAMGRSERARQLAAECLRLPPTDDDPWWNFRIGGLDVETLSWLRTSVRFQR